MYEGTSTEQKAKNAKSGLDSMSKPLLQSIRQRNALLPPFTQRRLNSVCLIYMACFSPLYRQSGTIDNRPYGSFNILGVVAFGRHLVATSIARHINIISKTDSYLFSLISSLRTVPCVQRYTAAVWVIAFLHNMWYNAVHRYE